MIGVLGVKRVAALSVLLVLSALMAVLLYFYIIPENAKAERDLRVVRASVSSTRAELAKLQQDIEFFEEQKSLYDNLDQLGFFSEQDRFLARRRIEAIQNESNILHMHYDISPAMIEENEEAAKADYVVLKTPATVDVDAMDDLDFYSFIYWIDNAFTGQVSITGFDMERVLDVNDRTLRRIGGGSPTTLLKGSLSFEWRTLIPRTEYLEEGMGSQ